MNQSFDISFVNVSFLFSKLNQDFCTGIGMHPSSSKNKIKKNYKNKNVMNNGFITQQKCNFAAKKMEIYKQNLLDSPTIICLKVITTQNMLVSNVFMPFTALCRQNTYWTYTDLSVVQELTLEKDWFGKLFICYL